VASRDSNNPLYEPKLDFESSHSLCLARIPSGSSVLDVGCASGYVARALKAKGSRVTALDQFPVAAGTGFDDFVQHDLDALEFPLDLGRFDYVLLLDVVEHLRSPELFLDAL